MTRRREPRGARRHPTVRTRNRRTPSPDFLRCPDCGKRGVTRRLNAAEDHWGCRTPDCDWYAFIGGNADTDITERKRLAEANPAAEHLDTEGINRW